MTDSRLHEIVRPGMDGNVVLLGFPRDTGVEINGGRTGSAQGPEQFRSWLKRFGTLANPEEDADLSTISISDAGDIPPGCSHEEAHLALAEKTAEILRRGGTPFVVGGGNDQSYPNASALLNCRPGLPVGVVNVDAHLDVRPLKDGRAHSGSPFRLLLEDVRFQGENFIEFASQGSQCSREHAEYVLRKKGRILWLSKLQEHGNAAHAFRETIGNLSWSRPSLFVSFDLDAVSANEAPGVSCPGVLGLSAFDAVQIARLSGQHPAVELFDLSEYNPAIESERTGRLAVAIFYYFCLGFAARKRAP
ncbi:MAG: formimidoylglutamase [Nitrospinae bacterium]|nr:formimidoylglutamase [Nitrospinota bacterium]